MIDYLTSKEKAIHNNLDAYIGNRVKNRRTLLGISQERLGSYLGVSFQQIQKYEKGINRISASSLYNISNVLSIDWSYFVEGYTSAPTLNEDGSLAYEVDHIKKGDAADLLNFYGKISDPQLRRRVIDIVKAIADTQRP
ncbi:MAG: helix-turn-helix domain-containing protein [Holosporaceae bacterium]|jgi:transcriptional regulator with XRE-family HTH domain|nr:helix-turn-helix domain-containing protein [Holosporaceae bacterium]